MVTEAGFIPKSFTKVLKNDTVVCNAPSNIALVKYWGKKPGQLPANPSISFTLSECKTITKTAFEPKPDDGSFTFDFLFEGQPKESFRPKISTFFERVKKYVPFITQYHFTIDSKNTFPHSSGIASSASGMAALAVNLLSIERMLNPDMTDEYFNQKASFLARLGSGSACRSINGSVVIWGQHEDTPGSSDLYGVPYTGVHEVFSTYNDTILLVDKGEKQVSSTLGHGLMEGHPFAGQRFTQAHENLSAIKKALSSGDLDTFIKITESEALTLHAMMMTSHPYFILMKPNTLAIINKIWQYRAETGVPVCFTLDAGANVHVLYPENVSGKVLDFIKNDLLCYCQNNQYICDKIGLGAQHM